MNLVVTAEPVIYDCLKHANDESFFIHVDVGERDYWKDSNCPFRKDPRTHLVSLPTLLRWKSPQRLDGEQCSSARLVGMKNLLFFFKCVMNLTENIFA